MEGQDKIEIDKIDIIGDEGQGNYQNNNGILGRYFPRNLYLLGRYRLHHLFLLFIFHFFLYCLKNHNFLLKKKENILF